VVDFTGVMLKLLLNDRICCFSAGSIIIAREEKTPTTPETPTTAALSVLRDVSYLLWYPERSQGFAEIGLLLLKCSLSQDAAFPRMQHFPGCSVSQDASLGDFLLASD